MKDPIDRQEAIRLITSYDGVVDKSVAKRLLMQMEPAESERETGEWIKNTGVFNHEFEWMYYKFSNCGESMHNRLDRPNFCPNCGADMRPTRGKQDE